MRKIKKSAAVFAVFCLLGATTIVYAEQQTGTKEAAIQEISEISNESLSVSVMATNSDAEETIQGNQQQEILPDTGFYNNHYYEEGRMVKNRFVISEGRSYYIDKDGFMVTGWYQDDFGKWHFYNENGVEEYNWVNDGGDWYYLTDGDYLTGWQQLEEDNAWYYFNESGLYIQNPDESVGTPDDSILKTANIQAIAPVNGSSFVWDKDRASSSISGLVIAGYPAELFMLSMAGETSGMSNTNALISGDRGRAYGVCQFDYRYDLTGFMNFAYQKHPELWAGFTPYLQTKDGDSILIYNETIGQTFLDSMKADYETCISDQLEYIARLYWDSCKARLNEVGFNLDERNIAVSAAILSVNVNCGPQTSIYLSHLSPDMTDEEMIREIYNLRNTVMAGQMVGSVRKGTTTRYRKAEPQMALDLLYGYTTIDSFSSYGGGVEWHGNPFTNQVTTLASTNRVVFQNSGQDLGEIVQQSDENLETKESQAETFESTEPAETEESEIEESSGSQVIICESKKQKETITETTEAVVETSPVLVSGEVISEETLPAEEENREDLSINAVETNN